MPRLGIMPSAFSSRDEPQMWSRFGYPCKFGLVIALILLLFVEFPVRLEIPVEVQGAEFEDRFAAFQTPACSGDLHAIFDHVTASTFDYTRGNGIPLSQVVGVVQIRGMI